MLGLLFKQVRVNIEEKTPFLKHLHEQSQREHVEQTVLSYNKKKEEIT